MWQIHAMIALDLARERAREAEAAAEHHRLLALVADERAEHPERHRPLARVLLASTLRHLSGGADAVADAACRAARRLDGQAA
jgi:hypothetical protein